MEQNQATGAAAREYGLKTAALIGEKIGARKLNPNSNEFEWKGNHVVIKLAHIKNTLVGVTKRMLKDTEVVIAAFEVRPDEYDLYSLSAAQYKANERLGKNGNGMVRITTFRKDGTHLMSVNLRADRDSVAEQQEQLEQSGEYDAADLPEGKKRVLRSIALRRGQPKFRNQLMLAYEGKCALTGISLRDVLEAAHITPFNGAATDKISNGLLLRSDIHALFDLKLLSIDPTTLTVYCSKKIQQEPIYAALNGAKIRNPAKAYQQPDKEALRAHFEDRVP